MESMAISRELLVCGGRGLERETDITLLQR